MNKRNGRDRKPIENLAAALQDCLNEAAERGAERAEARIEKKWGPRFDRQDETQRMIWKQCGGAPDTHLPIDD